MIWHSSDTDTVLNFLGTDKENGLSSQKAEELLTEKFLEAEKPMIKFLKMILAQLRQTAVLSVIIVSLICTFLSIVSKEAWWPYITVIIMLLIGAVSFCLQEYFTKDARHQVKNIRRCFVDVLRDGEVVHISSDRIVQGDIILLNTGDYIPVDARLIETINFSCDEYALTGEIVDVKKDCTFIAEDITAIEGRINMVFAGCSVTHGSAKAVVTDIDNDTEIKRIKLLNKKSDSNNIPFNKTIETVKKYKYGCHIILDKYINSDLKLDRENTYEHIVRDPRIQKYMEKYGNNFIDKAVFNSHQIFWIYGGNKNGSNPYLELDRNTLQLINPYKKFIDMGMTFEQFVEANPDFDFSVHLYDSFENNDFEDKLFVPPEYIKEQASINIMKIFTSKL